MSKNNPKTILVGALPNTNKRTMISHITKTLQDNPNVFEGLKSKDNCYVENKTIKELKVLYKKMKDCINDHNKSILKCPSVSIQL